MDVTITSPLTVAAIERSGFDIDGLIIGGIKEDCYTDIYGQTLTENAIYDKSYTYYWKSGLAADGNSRLILRVQTHKPGTVSFSFNDDIGAKLESLSRKELSASDRLSTTEFDSDLHQASAVLVAPERFPEGKNFPSDTFSVNVNFTDNDGKMTEGSLELQLETAPVILIPGLFGSAAKTFGINKNYGIYNAPLSKGFGVQHIDKLDYYANEVTAVTDSYNRFFRTFKSIFSQYAERGTVCTKADIVAYGMGGLLAEKYLSDGDKDSNDGCNASLRNTMG